MRATATASMEWPIARAFKLGVPYDLAVGCAQSVVKQDSPRSCDPSCPAIHPRSTLGHESGWIGGRANINHHHEDHASHQKVTAIIKIQNIAFEFALILCNKIQRKHACYVMSCL